VDMAAGFAIRWTGEVPVATWTLLRVATRVVVGLEFLIVDF